MKQMTKEFIKWYSYQELFNCEPWQAYRVRRIAFNAWLAGRKKIRQPEKAAKQEGY